MNVAETFHTFEINLKTPSSALPQWPIRFENQGHLDGKVRKMLAYCLLPREVAPGREWHACSLLTALAPIGQAIDDEKAQQ